MTMKTHLANPAKLLLAILTNHKARVQISYQVYRVSGAGRRLFYMHDIGLRAIQGHSIRNHMVPGY